VTIFDPDALTARAAELEGAMGAPGFWDDPAEAARVSTQHARVTRKLERYESLRHELDDARELL
jgi:peptide chain release factor 2